MPLQILIPAGVAIILFIVLIRIYPLLHMRFARLIFGKYSSRYVATCKRYTGQSPYPYCIKDDFINHIAGFFKISKDRQVFDSDLEISFFGTSFGTKFKKYIKENPKPLCINSNRLPLFELKVLGYRDKLFTVDVKKYLNFVDDVFFLGQLTFKSPTSDEIDEIVQVIAKKYLNNKKCSGRNFLIRGTNNVSLLCEYNGFHLTISYLDRSIPEINQIIDQYWESTTTLKLAKHPNLQTELMDKL